MKCLFNRIKMSRGLNVGLLGKLACLPSLDSEKKASHSILNSTKSVLSQALSSRTLRPNLKHPPAFSRPAEE